MTTKQCPKCGHKRDLNDGLPVTECPKCGIIYEKALKKTEQKKKCPFCGEEILAVAIKCKHCQSLFSQDDSTSTNNLGIKQTSATGQNKKIGCLGYVGAGVLIIIIFVVISSLLNTGPNKSTTKYNSKPSSIPSGAEPKPQIKIYEEGETINIGYTSYAVRRSWWSSKLSDNQFLDKKPDAMFLFVEIAVRNDDKKARTIPPFKLLDDFQAEYSTYTRGWVVDGAIGILADLNPDVQKEGFIIFDVPRWRDYKLKVSGGFWSKEDALIQLAPQ